VKTQPAVRVRSIRLRMARGQNATRWSRSTSGGLDDEVNLKSPPAATALAPPAGALEHRPSDRWR